ncbi:hypothetical protein J4474_03555 [Candidatus Pacearchaeota archaeon]|nr:hypothetical protein [Candidatus Pacearchaeota archaeon]
MIILYSILFGITMKLADLVDEHKLKLFKGDKFVFGFLEALFAILLIASRVDVANVTFAMVLAFLARMRLDHRNHAIAATAIFIGFAWIGKFEPIIFFTFLIVFLIFGALRDYLGDVRKKKDWLYKINEPAWYYVIPTAIYGFVTSNWIIFIVFTVYIIFYDLTKYLLYSMKKYKEL